MNARLQTILPAFGQHLEAQGGYLHGIYMLDNRLWGEVTAPKAAGLLTDLVWHPKNTNIAGACSDFDGLNNTIAMAKAGSPLAKAAIECRHAGHSDWHVVARGGALMQFSNLAKLLPDDEKFDPESHATSTQFDSGHAYYQYFGYGYASVYYKSWKGRRARLVRRFLIESLND